MVEQYQHGADDGLDKLDDLFADDDEMNGPSVVDYMSPTQGSKLRDISFFRQIPVQVTLEVGSVEVSLGDLMRAEDGTVIALDKAAGEPLDVKVNGRLLARGEVVLINGKYGLRLVEVINRDVIGDMDN